MPIGCLLTWLSRKDWFSPDLVIEKLKKTYQSILLACRLNSSSVTVIERIIISLVS